MTGFSARHVSVEESEGVLTVALAEAASDPSQYFLLQRTLEPDEQDVQLGLSEVYFEYGD